MAGPDRLERLTDLVLVLLRSPRPRTLEEIAAEVPGYPAGHDARRQAFERDKRLLRDEGIPVATEPVEGPEQFGYRIDPDAFFLPDLGLAPDEQAALHLAVAGVHLGDPSGRDALLKLGAAGVADVQPVASVVPPRALVPLFDAVRTQARVVFGYRGETRQVVPTGLRFRGGRWYLVGWDAGREGPRTFRVDRIEGTPEPGPPGSGQLPPGAEVGAGPDDPWRVGPGAGAHGDEDTEADDDVLLVRVDAVEADRVVAEVGETAVHERGRDGSVLLRLGVAAPEALRSWVLGLLDHAEVTGPPAARDAMVAWLEAIEQATPPEPSPAVPARSGASGAAADDRDVHEPPEAEPTGERARRASPQGASTRLRRLLAIVTWLARVGEAPLAEVAQRFGLPPDRVVHELELAACCGLPPYSPDMLLEIVVTDDTVKAFLPVQMARPRRLTAAEGLALAASARTILAVPGADHDGSLARALAKLDAVLGDHQRLVVDLDRPALLEAARQVVDAGRQARLEYHSASTDETTERTVDPLAVISLEGHWYLDAYCHRSQGLRRFRVDRIRALEPLDGRVEQRGDPAAGRPESFVPGPGAEEVQLVLDEPAAWVVDSVPSLGTRRREDGKVELALAVGGRAWLERLLLQLGPHAGVLGPPDLADAGRAAATRVLRRYRAPT